MMEVPKRVQEILATGEEARAVEGYDGDYWITDRGRVISLKSKSTSVLTGSRHDFGYIMVSFCKQGIADRQYVHCLVLETFGSDRPDGHECRHMDGDPTNNRITNLEWGTKRDNARDRYPHGTYGRKLTKHEAQEIKNRALAAENRNALAAEFGVTVATIHHIAKGLTWPQLKGEDYHHVQPRGSRTSTSKLTEDDVRVIRRLRKQGSTLQKLADQFNVSQSNISAISRRITWTHI